MGEVADLLTSTLPAHTKYTHKRKAGEVGFIVEPKKTHTKRATQQELLLKSPNTRTHTSR